MREEIEEAKKEKSRAYHRKYSREYRARNLEKQREYERIKAREYRARRKAQTAAAQPQVKQNNRQPRGIFRLREVPLLCPEKGAAYGRTDPPTVSSPTQRRNGQTMLRSYFFNHSSTETFRDKLLKTILADSSCLSASDGQEPEKSEILR